ncbi:MAG: response regulator [Gemmatimonadetes bacterium]|nr:response regulator [Gemmatimonadota bacterium]
MDPDLGTARILLVDDEDSHLQLLRRILERGGYSRIETTADPRRALPLFTRLEPDLILLDLDMPYLDGFQVMEQITPRVPEGTYLPILVLTGETAQDVKERALASGARDFLSKPFEPTEVLLRIRNLLEARRLHFRLQAQNERLEDLVRERTRELEEARLEILERLARAAEFRDDETGQHTRRVGDSAALLAAALGRDAAEVELMRRAAPLHDVGKIGVPDRILLKPGRLTEEEFGIMKRHTVIGARLLSGSRVKLLQLAEEIALYHHERWDGSGYAELEADAIPFSGRIVAVVDAFDAMTHVRPYKPAWPVPDAAAEIERQSGRQFDPAVVQAFLRVLPPEGFDFGGDPVPAGNGGAAAALDRGASLPQDPGGPGGGSSLS